MADKKKVNRVFDYIELSYGNLTQQINAWLQGLYNKSSILFNAASPYGQLLESQKELFMHNILYLKNAVKQIDVEQSNSKRAIQNWARIAGHNPSRAISAKGTLKFKLKQGINIADVVAGSSITIYENTTLRNKTNNLYYTLKVGGDKNIYSLTPGCQFFVAVVQGKYETQTYTGDGTASQSIQVTVNNTSTIDNFDYLVSLNGVNMTIKDHIYDMFQNEYACYTRTGFNGGLDVYFGNGTNGIIPTIGSQIQVTYLLVDGTKGNILNPKVNDFTFVDDIYDNDGNPIQVSNIFDLFVETDIMFGSDGESIDYTKTIIPYVSRNFVLATPEQFIYHLKKLNLFSKVNAFNTLDMVKIDIDNNGTLDDININEMYLYLIPRITSYFQGDVNYFNVPFNKFFLNDEQKQRIITYLKKQGTISITATIKILDPSIKKYIINVFIRRFDDSTEENIREQVIDKLSTYFANNERYDRIVKSDIISQLKDVDGIDSVNIEFVGKDNEDYHRDGALLSSKKRSTAETTYVANSTSVNVSSDYLKSVKIAQAQTTASKTTSADKSSNVKNAPISASLRAVTNSGVASQSARLLGPPVGAADGSPATTTVAAGQTTIVGYKQNQYNPQEMKGIDPILGDILIGRNELAILRGGWNDRNNVYFHEDPKSTDGFSSVNIIWKGITITKG